MIRMVRLSSTKKSNGTVSLPARHGVVESRPAGRGGLTRPIDSGRIAAQWQGPHCAKGRANRRGLRTGGYVAGPGPGPRDRRRRVLAAYISRVISLLLSPPSTPWGYETTL